MTKPNPDLEKYLSVNVSVDTECDVSRNEIESKIRNNISENATELVRNYIKNLKLDENQEIPEISCGFHYSKDKGLEYTDHTDIVDVSLKEEGNLDKDVYDLLVEKFKLLFVSAAENYDYN